ncbi:pentapeptide repeat-containing protein [Actinosynnema sp. NPDC023794]
MTRDHHSVTTSPPPLPAPQPSSERPALKPLSGTTITLIAVGIVLFTTAVVIVLWWAGTSGLTGRDLVAARFDALRVGLSIGVGSGGVFALYLAWRRQQATEVGLRQKERDQADVARAYELQERIAAETRTHQDRVAEDARIDSVQRRITDLYSKSVEQLGSDRAPVRLGGLYALERLAQDNFEHRQTVVDVLCAYLRMPYEPVVVIPTSEVYVREGTVESSERRESLQEREVRLTAQRILRQHLVLPSNGGSSEKYWPDVVLDLSGAVLIDFDLSACTVAEVKLNGTAFIGKAGFDRCRFEGRADFRAARFDDGCSFDGAVFSKRPDFGVSTFAKRAIFGTPFDRGAEFREGADFEGASFTGWASFVSCLFTGPASFMPVFPDGPAVNFEKSVDFSDATFESAAMFDQASFGDVAIFSSVHFGGSASFENCRFTKAGRFGSAVFSARSRQRGYEPGVTYTSFIGADFSEEVPLEVEEFTRRRE